MSKRTRPAIVRFEHRIDGERNAMGEQRLTAVRFKCRQSVPQLRRLIGQSRHPSLMAMMEARGKCGVIKTGPLRTEADAFQIDLQTGVANALTQRA